MVPLCLSRVRAKSHSSRTTLALSSSRERRSRSFDALKSQCGTFECDRPQIVFERGSVQNCHEPKLCVSQQVPGCVSGSRAAAYDSSQSPWPFALPFAHHGCRGGRRLFIWLTRLPFGLGKILPYRQAPEPGFLMSAVCVTSVWETQARPIVVQHPFGLLRASVPRPKAARRPSKSSSGKVPPKEKLFGHVLWTCDVRSRPCSGV